jgi:hypothetical protein
LAFTDVLVCLAVPDGAAVVVVETVNAAFSISVPTSS